MRCVYNIYNTFYVYIGIIYVDYIPHELYICIYCLFECPHPIQIKPMHEIIQYKKMIRKRSNNLRKERRVKNVDEGESTFLYKTKKKLLE